MTLMELLVVIGIVVLLLAIVLLTANELRGLAQVAGCLSNQHQISVGLTGYSRDHNSRFISPRTSPVGFLPNDRLWVRSFDEYGHDRLDPQGFERDAALRDGALWAYVGTVKAYRSPLDPTARLRSYSLNGFVSDLPDMPSNPEYNWSLVADRMSKIHNPANTLHTIIEHDPNENLNGHGWVINTYAEIWMDYPAFWAPRGTVPLSFVDGSTENIKLVNPHLGEELTQHALPVTAMTRDDWDQFVKWVRVDE
jgi:hypothetical protein